MKAVRIYEHGGLDKLIYDDLPQPDCPPDKIKINIKVSALNHLDIWVRNGLPGISIPLPMILGSDGSGTIVEVGSDIDKFQRGNEVVIQPGTFCKNCKQIETISDYLVVTKTNLKQSNKTYNHLINEYTKWKENSSLDCILNS